MTLDAEYDAEYLTSLDDAELTFEALELAGWEFSAVVEDYPDYGEQLWHVYPPDARSFYVGSDLKEDILDHVPNVATDMAAITRLCEAHGVAALVPLHTTPRALTLAFCIWKRQSE